MKKILSLALCLVLVAAVFASCTSKRYDPNAELSSVVSPAYVAEDVVTYEVPEEQLVFEYDLDYSTEAQVDVLKITGYTGDAEELVIPERLVHPEYGNLSVVAISDSAFINNETLKKVTLPWSVSIIGTGAFQNCINLTDVEIFEGETVYLTKVVEEVSAPVYVSGNGETAFDDYVENTVRIAYYQGETVTYSKAFAPDEEIPEEEYVPAQLKEIKDNAFVGSGLTNINIPETVTSVGDHAFSTFLSHTPWYDSLTDEKVIVGDGILLKYNNVNNVSEVELGEEVKHIAYYAFIEPLEVTEEMIPLSVTLGSSVESISKLAVFSLDGKYSQVLFKVGYQTPAVDIIDATAYNYEIYGQPDPVPNPFVWEFDDEASLESWSPSQTEVSLSEPGVVHIKTTGNDPIFGCNDSLNLPADSFKTLVIKMKHNINDAKSDSNKQLFNLQVYFGKKGVGYSETDSVKYEMEQTSAGEFIEYSLDMSQVTGWSNIISSFRIDVSGFANAEFWIDSVQFIPADPAFDHGTLLKPVTKYVPEEENPYKYKFAEQALADAWTTTGMTYSYDDECIHGVLDAASESTITSPALSVPGEAYRKLIVRTRNKFDVEKTDENKDSFTMKVYFDNGEGYSEERSKTLEIAASAVNDDGSLEKNTYTFDMYELDGWYSTIKGIKIVFGDGLSGEFWIDKIEFEAEKKLTRADFVTILYQSQYESGEGESVFTDVVVYDDYYMAVLWATAKGIVSANEENLFYPDRLLTAAEYTEMLSKFAGTEMAAPADSEAVVYEMDAKNAVDAIVNPPVVEEAVETAEEVAE